MRFKKMADESHYDRLGGIDANSFATRMFNVGLFYSILRSEGCDPFVRNGGIYLSVTRDSPTLRAAGRWAAVHDPAGAFRLEYVRAVWNARAPFTEIVELG